MFFAYYVYVFGQILEYCGHISVSGWQCGGLGELVRPVGPHRIVVICLGFMRILWNRCYLFGFYENSMESLLFAWVS